MTHKICFQAKIKITTVQNCLKRRNFQERKEAVKTVHLELVFTKIKES